MADDSTMRRGLLLLAMSAQYPKGLLMRFLEQQFGSFYAGRQKAMAQDLAYLQERGLIRRDEEEALGTEIVTLTCTADGLLVAEGTRKDPGVVIVG